MASKNIYSVGQVNAYIKRMFSEDYLLRQILVRGEVSNCKYHSSGHIYFTLKDASGTLSCVMFAGRRRGLSFPMKEGDQVVVQGSVDVYERGGSYQLYAERIIRDGAGLLNERYELLKKQLEEMGMFDEQYKQPIPKYIRRLGVVTAPTGAAVRDIINIATRRNPFVQIILYPAIVQGDEAAPSIIRGIHALEQMGEDDPAKKVDVIIIGRGGGSLEDLWAFNEEAVAQAVFECSIPIISAVGHETDTVITDYVADLRAPTPSAAAELAVYEFSAFTRQLAGYRDSLNSSIQKTIVSLRHRNSIFTRELDHLSPAARLREKRMQLLFSQEQMERLLTDRISRMRYQLRISQDLEQLMLRRIESARRRAESDAQLGSDMKRILTEKKHSMQLLAARLEKVSPILRLSGGYGFLTDEKDMVITSSRQIQKGSRFTVRMKDGSVKALAEEVSTQSASALR